MRRAHRLRIAAVLFIAVFLSSCAFLQKNKDLILDIGKTGVIVLSADDLAIQIADYIAGDGIAINGLLLPDGPVDYGLRVADFMKGNLNLPAIDVALQYPQYLADFKAKMLEGQAVLIAYAIRSGKPIPQTIQVMWGNGLDAIRLFDKAKEFHDRTLKLSILYETLKPYALLGLKLGGVPIPIKGTVQQNQNGVQI
jgi:hypothetical protein